MSDGRIAEMGSRYAVSNRSRLILASVSAYRPPDGARIEKEEGRGKGVRRQVVSPVRQANEYPHRSGLRGRCPSMTCIFRMLVFS